MQNGDNITVPLTGVRIAFCCMRACINGVMGSGIAPLCTFHSCLEKLPLRPLRKHAMCEEHDDYICANISSFLLLDRTGVSRLQRACCRAPPLLRCVRLLGTSMVLRARLMASACLFKNFF